MSYVSALYSHLSNMKFALPALPEVLHLLLKQASLTHMTGWQHLVHFVMSLSHRVALQISVTTIKSAQWPLQAPLIMQFVTCKCDNSTCRPWHHVFT